MSPGEEQRFRELYDRTYDRIWAFVLRRLPDEHAAKDAVAETFLAIWRRMPDVPDDARLADAWVFATARRVLANTRRGTTRRMGLFNALRQRPVDVVVDYSTGEESNTQVLQALEQLRPAQREILSLAFWEELDVEQIAQALGCSKNAAAIRLTRARQALETAFESLPNEHGDPDARNRKGGKQ